MARRRSTGNRVKQISPEDRWLVPGQFESLNREFYASKLLPDKYLGMRLRSLLLTTSEAPEIRAVSEAGFQVGPVNLKYSHADEDEDEEQARAEVDGYLLTESTVLLHHAGEVLLRLFFAHEGFPECPWLETARLRRPGVFPTRIRTLLSTLGSESTKEAIAQVFTGCADVDHLPEGLTAERWQEQLDGLRALLARVGSFALAEGDLYNSAKHGLTTRPSEVAVKFDFPDDAPNVDLSMNGKALRYFRKTKGGEPGDHAKWDLTTSWMSIESNLTLTYLITQQVATLMALAKARYVPDAEPQFKMSRITREYVDTSSTVGWPQKTFILKTMGAPLAYYVPTEGSGT